jgi:transposase
MCSNKVLKMEKDRNSPLTEELFQQVIEPLIIRERKKSGRPTKVSHYKFFCGVLYVLRTGISWRDMPQVYGNWHTIYTRYKRWSENGFFWRLLRYLQSLGQVLMEIVFVDVSLVPLHRHGGGALKK